MAHGVDVRRTVVFITCLAMVNGGVMESSTSKDTPVRQWCSAPTVVEGQTGEVTFFFGKDILSSESIFAVLNRADDPNILVCHQKPKLACRVKSKRYELDGFINESLTLKIPNITKEFEGAYRLQVYTNGSPQPLSNCTLLVKARPEDKRCIAPFVTEGQTGKLTFFIRPDILASEDFFATLRRRKYPMMDILVCDRQSPVKCTATSSDYKSNGIVNDSLTLLIPNATKDLEDTYYLQVYAGGQPGPTENCPLLIKAKRREDLRDQSCLPPSVTEGQTGKMTFFIGADFLSSYDFFATLRRANNPEKDILVCDRQSPIKCLVTDKLYETEGIVDHRLTLRIPNVTQEFEDTYYLQVYANGLPGPRKHCVLPVKVNNGGKGTSKNTDTQSSILMYSLIVIAVVFVPTTIGILCWVCRRRRKKWGIRGKSKRTDKVDREEEESKLMEEAARAGQMMSKENKSRISRPDKHKGKGREKRDTPELREGTEARQPGDGDTSTTTAATSATADTTTVPTNAPVKPNPLLAARVKKRMAPTDKNTPIGMALQKALETNNNPFFEMKAYKRSRPDKTEDEFVTAKDARYGLDGDKLGLRLKPGRRNRGQQHEEEERFHTAFDIPKISYKDPSV